MKKLTASLFALFVFAVFADAQTAAPLAETWGCAAKDYKCQLDVRMKALQADPKDPENYYNLGLVFQRSGDHKQAVETFTMYLAIPGIKAEYLADGYNNRAISHKALKHLDLAEADYTKAIELNPNSRLAVRNRAALRFAQDRLDAALVDIARAISLDPAYSESYYDRGKIYAAKKEYAGAAADFEKYVTLATDPAYLADGYLELGNARYYTGDHQKAVAAFTRSIELRPNDPRAYRNRAIVYRSLNKPDLATLDDRKSKELETQR